MAVTENEETGPPGGLSGGLQDKRRRRSRGDGSVSFDHMGTPCRDTEFHRRCRGRWIGEVNLGKDGSGKRRRVRVSGRTKTEAIENLKNARKELDQGVRSSATYTVNNAVESWLTDAMADRSGKTVKTQRELLDPLLALIGEAKLRDLEADDVSEALSAIAPTRTSRTVRDTRAALIRAITYAQARGLVGRNVASLIAAPAGKSKGRPSRALTLAQAEAVLKAARDDRLHAYVVLSLLTGIRTEEARALRWDHVDLVGDPDAKPPVPPTIAVWRSVRAHGDVKTTRSRRTLALPARAVKALAEHHELQAGERDEAGKFWEEHGLVFTTTIGRPLDPANVRRSFRRICAAAGIGENWSPRELRHTFVSIMSDSGVPVEKIADLVGHTGGSRVTETIYRQQIRPAITEGAEVMDKVLKPKRRVRRRPSAAQSRRQDPHAGTG